MYERLFFLDLPSLTPSLCYVEERVYFCTLFIVNLATWLALTNGLLAHVTEVEELSVFV